MQGFLLLQESLLKKRITGSFRAKSAKKGKSAVRKSTADFLFSYRLPDGTPWVYPGLNALVSEQYRFMLLIVANKLILLYFVRFVCREISVSSGEIV